MSKLTKDAIEACDRKIKYYAAVKNVLEKSEANLECISDLIEADKNLVEHDEELIITALLANAENTARKADAVRQQLMGGH